MALFLSDLRFACRGLLRERGFSVTALLTLALGMALFLTASTVTRAYLLRDLPYPSAERLHWVRYGAPGVPQPREMERLDWASLSDLIEHPVAWDLDVFYLLGGDHAESLRGAWVTPGFIEALGVRPALGRGIARDAFQAGGANEVLISHRLWQSRLGGDAGVIGRSFAAYVSDRPEETERFTIVGVLPETFWHVNPYTEMLAPLRGPTYPYMARLRAGVSPDVLRDRVNALVTAGARDVPVGWSVTVESVHASYVAAIRPTLRAVMLAGVMVLLVACANVAALLLVRGARRRHEVAIRSALGAGRLAIARLLAAEAIVLGLAASGLALIATAFTIDALGPHLQDQLGRRVPGGLTAMRLDWPLVACAALTGTGTALLCALAPLSAVLRPHVAASVHGGRTGTATRATSRFRSSLLVLEIAASLALLAGAALMFQSAQHLGRVDLGVSVDDVVTGSLTLRQSRYPDAPSRVAIYDRLMKRLEAAPGNEAVAFSSMWPLQQAGPQPVTSAAGDARVPATLASPGYFAALGIPMRAGRPFTAADRHGAEPVAIVSETLARRLWPGASPIGAYLSMPPPHTASQPATRRLVVGVAADVRQGALDADLADVYVPLLQEPGRFAFALVRTSAPPDTALRLLTDAARDADPEIAIDRGSTFGALADRAVAGSRLLASLLAGFAIVAALLSLVGIYGAVAYAVRQREREIAVRVAIGANPARIVRLFVRQSAGVVACGLALGIPAALAVGRLIESQLFGVTARDPGALLAAAAAFAAAALAATWWPARRAAATDPAIALRSE
jgi:putative ABC transport system permease protein